MKNAFLPENYEVPEKPSNYTRLSEGVHRLRVLTSPLLGWEVWTDKAEGGRAVKRFAYEAAHPMDAKHFWAMIVYNYNTERIQILSVAQKTIQDQLKALASNPDWGSPLNYNISITRTGRGLNDTEYRVDGSPTSMSKPIAPEVTKAFKEAGVDMKVWLEGGEPFAKDNVPAKSFEEEFPDKGAIDVETAEVDDLPF